MGMLPERVILFNEGIRYYGLKEYSGRGENNPEIIQMFEILGYEGVQDDETAWCSAFVNYIALSVRLEISGKLNARSWLDVGEVVITPQIGDVVILWREQPHSWKGHVGLYVSEDDNNVYVLGGNQNNMVCIKPYPKARLLGYRRLRRA